MHLKKTLREGTKNDTNTLRFDLIPTYPLCKLAEVYSIGARKYSDNNWRSGFRWGRVFAAMLRHAWKWWAGETYDATDGQHHLSSVVWFAFTLIEFEHRKAGIDDRVADSFTWNVVNPLGVRKPSTKHPSRKARLRH